MGKGYFNYYNKKNEQPLNNWFYIIVLYISFIWVTVYQTENTLVDGFWLGYGKLFEMSSENFFYEVVFLLAEAGVFLLFFELLFWLYRSSISFRVYAFIVPLDRFKADCRLAYATRNLIFGLYLNLCFIYPYLYMFNELLNLIVTMTTFLLFMRYIYKKYSEPLISQFVFKTFALPIFLYEALVVISYIWGIL